MLAELVAARARAQTAVWFYILGNTEPALGKQIGA
jgi:hypothetical protein